MTDRDRDREYAKERRDRLRARCRIVHNQGAPAAEQQDAAGRSRTLRT
ncbi:MAG: hypothetical protein H0U52_16260 [Chloroflexi bacterium]|nr:hypothetical protein [Chloroflexota bacterium]